MAASLTARAERRATEVYQAAITEALGDGHGYAAFNEAIRHLRSAMAGLRRHRPADAAITDAELAGSIEAIAAGLHAYKPARPAGRGMPGPGQLLAVYQASFTSAAGGGTDDD